MRIATLVMAHELTPEALQQLTSFPRVTSQKGGTSSEHASASRDDPRWAVRGLRSLGAAG
jgi:hypothetical protein